MLLKDNYVFFCLKWARDTWTHHQGCKTSFFSDLKKTVQALFWMNRWQTRGPGVTSPCNLWSKKPVMPLMLPVSIKANSKTRNTLSTHGESCQHPEGCSDVAQPPGRPGRDFSIPFEALQENECRPVIDAFRSSSHRTWLSEVLVLLRF